MKSAILITPFAVVASILTLSQAAFAQIEPTDPSNELYFPNRVSRAKAIIHAGVLDVKAQYTPDGKSIETFVTFGIKENIKGNIPQATLILRFAGGKMKGGNTLMVIAEPMGEMPSFEDKVGKEVILLLTSETEVSSKLLCPIQDWRYGLFTIEKSSGTQGEHLVDGWGRKIEGFKEDGALSVLSPENKEQSPGVTKNEFAAQCRKIFSQSPGAAQ